MSIYDPLTRHLRHLPGDVWHASFAEVERIINRNLPKSAYQYRPWWANQKDGNHSQSKAWQDAGWETGEVNLGHKTVRFERKTRARQPAAEPVDPLADLWQRAERVTGTGDRTELTKAALEALIRQELARQVAQLGGSDPNATAPPRRRFW